jgi:hypothetical protein
VKFSAHPGSHSLAKVTFQDNTECHLSPCQVSYHRPPLQGKSKKDGAAVRHSAGDMKRKRMCLSRLAQKLRQNKISRIALATVGWNRG